RGPRARGAVDLDPPFRVVAPHAEPRCADLVAEYRKIADLEPGLGEQLAEAEPRPADTPRPATAGSEQRGPFVDIEPADAAVDSNARRGRRLRQASAERERAVREREPAGALLERHDEAPRRADIALDIEPCRTEREIELQARRLGGLLRERLRQVQRETGEVRPDRDAQRSRAGLVELHAAARRQQEASGPARLPGREPLERQAERVDDGTGRHLAVDVEPCAIAFDAGGGHARGDGPVEERRLDALR